MVQFLVGRVADPILGVATGVFAYYIWETDKRKANERPPPGRRLHELVQRYVKNEQPGFALYSGPNPFGDRIQRVDVGGSTGKQRVV